MHDGLKSDVSSNNPYEYCTTEQGANGASAKSHSPCLPNERLVGRPVTNAGTHNFVRSDISVLCATRRTVMAPLFASRNLELISWESEDVEEGEEQPAVAARATSRVLDHMFWLFWVEIPCKQRIPFYQNLSQRNITCNQICQKARAPYFLKEGIEPKSLGHK
jgi:hypothetical protein